MLRESRPIWAAVFVLVAFITAADALASDIGQEIASQVSLTSYQHYLDDLLYTHDGNNRSSRTGPDHDPAQANIVATLQSFGLSVEIETFTDHFGTYRNVIATQPGMVHPDTCFVIGGHYDSAGTPGADDNASGVAGVMEIARVISQYSTEYTIKYIAFDAEENGLIGSKAYVSAHYSDDIRGMISMDMIAHDHGSYSAEISGFASCAPIMNALNGAIIAYGDGLSASLITETYARSDHGPFQSAGYQACLLIEGWPDSNPCYHRACDSVDTAGYISYAFAVGMTRSVAGYLADNARALYPIDCNTGQGCELGVNGDEDCNANLSWDACDILCGTSVDVNLNGIPDECEPHEAWYVDAANCPGPGSGTPADPFCTMQAAIDAAGNGFVEITVADGIYTGTGNKDLDFGGKGLALRSANGAANCIIDCQGNGRGFYFHSGETPVARVDGFTIRNGNASASSPGGAYGGGVYCSRSSPTLTNCTISGNTAFSSSSATYGGGVYSFRSKTTLSNCIISGNTASNGGGVYCTLSEPMLTNCTISGNTSLSGGGVYSNSSDPTLTDCTINGNTASSSYSAYGGGVYSSGVGLTMTNCTISSNTSTSSSSTADGAGLYFTGLFSPTLTECSISGNTAKSSGGGMYCNSYALTLSDCTINSNTASSNGGGLYCAASAMLTNCIISRNKNTSNYGGGVFFTSSDATMTNCTINGNTTNATYGHGGGIYCGPSSTSTLTNCILWGDTQQELYLSDGTAVVTYCDIQGGWTGTGNIDIDPLFVDAATGNCHLLPNSPCIDVGTNDPLGGLPGEDAEGNPRPLDGNADGVAVADMGAYESNPALPWIAVTPTQAEFYGRQGHVSPEQKQIAIHNSSGGTLAWALTSTASWLRFDPAHGESTGEVDQVLLTADAATLTRGIYSATLSVIDPHAPNNPRTVQIVFHVGGPRYVPAEYTTIQAAIDAAQPLDDVQLADGTYTGVGNKNLDFQGKATGVRSISGNPAACIIDCQGSGRGFYFHTQETADTFVEGITIRRGLANFSSPGGANGGGVYCTGASPKLTNCTITGCAALSYGGALYCTGSSPTLSNCTVNGNTATYSGGGTYCVSSSNPTLTGCVINNGTAETGGGLSFVSSSAKLDKCVITANTASGTYAHGGGVYCSSSSPMLTNCRLNWNRAVGVYATGGSLFCSSSSPMLINCTASGNSASYRGGIHLANFSNPGLANCILWSNTPQEIYQDGVSNDPTVTYSDIQNGWIGIGNINADPLFVDTPNGNFRLTAGSPCIDAGSNAAVPAGITTDLDGNPRILFSRPQHIVLPQPGQPVPPPPVPAVDMGAYEFKIAPLPEPDEVPIGSPIMKPNGRGR